MRCALLLSLCVLAACGRDALTDGETVDGLTVQQQSLVGHYEFGPMVGKGLPPGDDQPYPLSRLADLELEPDGTFEMRFMMGCVGNFGSGTWVAVPGGARLELSQYSVWTDSSGADVKVSQLLATPTAGGLTITGQGHRGAISQKWDTVGAP